MPFPAPKSPDDLCACGEVRAGHIFRASCTQCAARQMAHATRRMLVGYLAMAPDDVRAAIKAERAYLKAKGVRA